jgi:hypothetical protein
MRRGRVIRENLHSEEGMRRRALGIMKEEHGS